jgi:hypothetical protein
MRRNTFGTRVLAAGFAMAVSATSAYAAPVYLNFSNISVALGPSMPVGEAADTSFENRTTSASLASIIDLPTAASGELHNQSTHVWLEQSLSALELDFDFGVEYDLTTLHFWNYHTENFDVDNIAFTFFNAAHVQVGTLNSSPALGGGGSDAIPIFAQDYALNFPSNVRYVNAVLTGTNSEVDFNNIGFTAELSNPVPEPAMLSLLGLGLAALGRTRRLRRRQ